MYIFYQMMDIHAGGHAKEEETKMMIKLLNPKYFVPIQANHFLLVLHGGVAEKVGIPRSNIFILDNGTVMEFDAKSARKVNEKFPYNVIAVDGLGVGDVGQAVLRDRKHMSENGIFVVIYTVDKKTFALKSSPDIISRGFIYMRGSEKLLNEAREIAKRSFENQVKKQPSDISELKSRVRKDLEKYIYKKIEREPMILPVIIKT